MKSVNDVMRSESKMTSMCRFEVEIAMTEMLNKLQAKGWSQAELALTLADAAEDYVISVASKVKKVN
jgi:hypothetical protein